MSRNPVTHFQRAAEAAGYPALLLVTMAAAAIMVNAVVVLALMQSGWAFAVSLLSLIAALSLLWGGFNTAFTESDGAGDGEAIRAPAAAERGEVVPLQESRHASSPEHDKQAA
jgi:membrane protein implicated in regulation of membrane protease activity